MIQTNSRNGAVFPTARSPVTLKEELPAPKETLIKAGWFLVREWLSVQAQ